MKYCEYCNIDYPEGQDCPTAVNHPAKRNRYGMTEEEMDQLKHPDLKVLNDLRASAADPSVNTVMNKLIDSMNIIQRVAFGMGMDRFLVQLDMQARAAVKEARIQALKDVLSLNPMLAQDEARQIVKTLLAEAEK